MSVGEFFLTPRERAATKKDIRRRCHPSSILGEILTVVDLEEQSDKCLKEFLDMLKTPATEGLKKELGGK